MRRWQKAYLTVEAALVIPMVLTVILFLIYMMFYQYDRCLMEQDMGMALIKGSAYEGESGEDRVRYTIRSMAEKDSDKYLMWNSGAVAVKQERNVLKVAWEGQMLFPFAGWQIDAARGIWAAGAEYESSLLSPAFLVRSYRKIIEKTEGEKECKQNL